MYYATTDIHGEFETFMNLLKEIQFTPTDYLFILGDVIDRGKEPLTTLFYILQQPNMKLLRGNHEEMLLSILENCNDILQLLQDTRIFMSAYELEDSYQKLLGVDFSCEPWLSLKYWADNGGVNTMAQLVALDVDEVLKLQKALRTFPYYEIYKSKQQQYLLVHAGINARPFGYNGLPIWKELKCYQRPKDFLWSRESFYKNKALEDVYIIFGHTPTFYINGTYEIWKDHVNGDKMGIDCGISLHGQQGKMGCINLDSFEEYYISK